MAALDIKAAAAADTDVKRADEDAELDLDNFDLDAKADAKADAAPAAAAADAEIRAEVQRIDEAVARFRAGAAPAAVAAAVVQIAAIAQARVDRRQQRVDQVRAVRAENTVVPSDRVPWKLATHTLTQTRVLTADDPRAPTPPGFKEELRPPQATLLHAMLEIEANPQLKVIFTAPPESGRGMSREIRKEIAERLDGKPGVLQTNRCVISEELGFGKTVLVLALVCASRRPRAVPAPVNHPLSQSSADRDMCMGFLPELTVRYNRILPVTLVAASPAVITQWIASADRFTSLKYMTVENIHTLKAFESAFREKRLAGTDLIFVKIGGVTANFIAEGEKVAPSSSNAKATAAKATAAKATAAKASTRRLLDAIAVITEGMTFARLIVDDFDTIKLATGDNFLPALFTWPVSATRRGTTVWPPDPDSTTAPTFLRGCTRFPVVAAAHDAILYGPLSLQCDRKYVAEYINTTTIAYRRVVVRGGRAATLLHHLGVAADIVEMVNADAIGTAADALGINAKTPRDLVARILKDRCDKYRHACLVLERVEDARGRTSRGFADATREEVKNLRAELKSAEMPVADLVKDFGPSEAVREMYLDLGQWATKERAAFGGALQRMRDNIREQECQCCHVPLTPDDDVKVVKDAKDVKDVKDAKDAKDAKDVKDAKSASRDDAFVLNCCQIIVCERCIVAPDDRGVRTFVRACPNCASALDAKADLIRIGKDVDLMAALDDHAIVGDTAAQPPPHLHAAVTAASGAWRARRIDKDEAARLAGVGADEAARAAGADAAAGDTWVCRVSFGADEAARAAFEKSGELAIADIADASLGTVNDLVYTAGRLHAAPAPKLKVDGAKLIAESPRLKALIQILRGEKPECLRDEDAKSDTAGLLEGKRQVPWPANKRKKYLIFTLFAESTRHVEAALAASGFRFLVLRGLRSQKDAIMAQFQADIDIMVVTAARDCAGLHMPFVAMGIEYHYVGDSAVRGQMRGRYHRTGREYSSECVTIMNESEMTM